MKKKVMAAVVALSVVPFVFGETASITFIVDDSEGQTVANTPIQLKGSWNKTTYEYDSGWDGGATEDMYDDGTHGDATASDNKWTLTLDLVVDNGANTWQWGAQDAGGAWLIEGDNPQFTLSDTSAQTLTYVIPAPSGETANVTFQADMSDLISQGWDDSKHTMEVRGGFNGWGGGDELAADLVDPTLYSITVEITEEAGTEIEWKFKANPDSIFLNSGWETIAGNRTFTFTGQDLVLDAVEPMTAILGEITAEANIGFAIEWIDGTVNANTGAAFPTKPDTIVVNGSFTTGGSTGWFTWGDCMGSDCATPAASEMPRLVDTDGDGIYTGSLVLAAGHGNAFTWKMGAYYPGIDSLAAVSSNAAMDNEAGFGADRMLTIPLSGGEIAVVDTFGSNNSDNPWLTIARNSDILPGGFKLLGNYPNPFNPKTNVVFDLDFKSDVTVTIYSILGREINTVYKGTNEPGRYTVTWYGTDRSGHAVPSGVYLFRVKAGERTLTGKMLLLK